MKPQSGLTPWKSPSFSVVYEDSDLLVLNKPSGAPSLPHSTQETNTAVNHALALAPDLEGVGDKKLEPGLVHRLDTQTSGLLLFAKTQAEFLRLKALFKKKSISKFYRAKICGSQTLPPLPFVISTPLGHSKKSSKKMIPVKGVLSEKQIKGKTLKAYTVIQKIYGHSDYNRDVEVHITTGVMHQIRAHLSSEGLPLLGDTLYGGKKSSRTWLHAWKLGIPKKDGFLLELEAPLPLNWTKQKLSVAIIIPAFNEEDSIAHVLKHIPKKFQSNIYVADNNCTDKTAEVATNCGAQVIPAPIQGYGSACLAAVEVAKKSEPDVFIFLDADFSDYPEDMLEMLDLLEVNELDFVVGSRMLGKAEPGALLPQANFGNRLATLLLWLRFGFRFTDLGPFRIIRREAYEKLEMKDPNFGWTMEMQVKALKKKFRVGEVSVRYRKRVGVSKITGTIKGTLLASYKILWTFFRYSLPGK